MCVSAYIYIYMYTYLKKNVTSHQKENVSLKCQSQGFTVSDHLEIKLLILYNTT